MDTEERTIGNFVRTAVQKLIDQQYAHIRYPSAIMAQVTAMADIGDGIWQYTLKPLRSDRSASDFPEIPDVKSRLKIKSEVGGIVAVAMLYGQLYPIIIDEVYL